MKMVLQNNKGRKIQKYYKITGKPWLLNTLCGVLHWLDKFYSAYSIIQK